ncbi:MAG: hypothetical protein CM1200mP20_05960 [Pseudomonadota bacterium]|nr:MAG: hypothetical protein CM1200mP20_05960 [Pseudomonadota bacterium]
MKVRSICPFPGPSTILSPDVDSYIHRFDGEKALTDITYGRVGRTMPGLWLKGLGSLEGGAGTVVTASGLSAITLAWAHCLTTVTTSC